MQSRSPNWPSPSPNWQSPAGANVEWGDIPEEWSIENTIEIQLCSYAHRCLAKP